MALDIFRAGKSAKEAAGHIALTIFALEGCIWRQPYAEVLSPFWRDMNFPWGLSCKCSGLI